MVGKGTGKAITIGRKATNKVEESIQQSTPIVPSSGGITLASSQVIESDSFKAELIKNGYTILSENEYGVIAKKERGKPSFLPRTINGYFEEEQRITILLPKSINVAVKIRVANQYTNIMQYLTELVMKDLKENNQI